MVLSLSKCQFLSLINPHEFEHFEPYPIGNNPDDCSYLCTPYPVVIALNHTRWAPTTYKYGVSSKGEATPVTHFFFRHL